MTERLFFALWPDGRARCALATLARELAGGCGRPAHPMDLHLTLIFLGGLDEEARRCVQGIPPIVGVAPFALHLDQVGHWLRPGVIWCGPATIPDGLGRLVARLGQDVAGCGLARDPRSYRPHVTLVRGVRTARPLKARPPLGGIAWPVTELVLAGGRGGAPPRYRVLRRWPLPV